MNINYILKKRIIRFVSFKLKKMNKTFEIIRDQNNNFNNYSYKTLTTV